MNAWNRNIKSNKRDHLRKLMKKDLPYSILSIDGGGIRGVISCEVLKAIEEAVRLLMPLEVIREDKMTLYMFDTVGGTSIGALSAASFTLLNPRGK